MSYLLHIRHGWFLAIFLFSTAVLLANIVHYLLFHLLRRRQHSPADQTHRHLTRFLAQPARWVFLITCTLLILPIIPLPSGVVGTLREVLNLALIGVIGWLGVGCVYLGEELLVRRYDITVADNVRARRVRTQTQVLRRIAITFILIVDAGAMLWTFHDPRIWHYGTGLVASAGVASLVLATAAKSTAANFLAGLQIAITEPIRIDDVVIVQGEWGRIEEITTSYVVVKIWDLRRLIVPLTYFIEQPFQNWTRENAALLGTAFLYVDYSVPIAALRTQLTKILEGSPLWDRQVNSVQVTNCTEHTVEVRCLLSARNASEQFDLRCVVREEMLKFIQDNYPDTFPRTRISSVRGVPDRQQDAPLLRDFGTGNDGSGVHHTRV